MGEQKKMKTQYCALAFNQVTGEIFDLAGDYSLNDVDWWIEDICRLYPTGTWRFTTWIGMKRIALLIVNENDSRELFSRAS